MEPFDVFDSGRMAGNHIGAGLINTVGAMSWNELQTKDMTAAAAFFKGLLGWETETTPDGSYTAFVNNGRMAGGMMQITEEWGPVPPNWSVYFSVADCAATVAKVQELGGNVIMPPMESTGVGTMAVVQDPQGAAFTVIQLLNAEHAWE
jgi:predicted enzyme related to lactoylglutathione lyase